MNAIRRTEYAIATDKLSSPVTLLVIADLHDKPFDELLPMLSGATALLVPGDICNRYDHECARGLAFLREASRRVPTFFSFGNHDKRFVREKPFFRALYQTGAVILDNRYERFGELVICGWYRPSDEKLMNKFEREDGCRVLLCHRPEDYIQRLRTRDVDLAVAGHAHGGQVRIFGQGLYAPGQGIFPKYTRGVVDGRLVISAGVSNAVGVPRLFNPREVVSITLGNERKP